MLSLNDGDWLKLQAKLYVRCEASTPDQVSYLSFGHDRALLAQCLTPIQFQLPITRELF